MEKISKNFARLENRLKKLNTQEELAKQKQHSKGKLSARERIHILFDDNTFTEIDTYIAISEDDDDKKLFGDGVITGYGKIKGRTVYVYAQDFSIQGGSLGLAHAKKIAKIQKLALKTGSPIVALIDSGGARIQEGVESLVGYGTIFHLNVQSSGVIPQLSVIMGPAAGGAVYSPALTDFVFMTNKTSYMFVTGPNVVKEVLNEDVSFEDLGGAKIHSEKSGVTHFVYEDDENTILGVRKLLSYLPSNHLEHSPFIAPDAENLNNEKLIDIVPEDPNKPYDIKKVIDLVVDKNSFLEISDKYASNLVIGFARLEGFVIGIVANQPKVLAGSLDINASLKGARFVRFCDAFNIPLLVLEDVPGFMPGLDQESNGIIKHGAKLLFAFSEATVPKVTVILRKAYGGAYVVMNCQSIGSDFTFAWPSAEIAVMGPEGAVAIINKKELLEADDALRTKKELVAIYREKKTNPYIAEELGYVDEVINPAKTREKIINSFEILQRKQIPTYNKKHNNLPL